MKIREGTYDKAIVSEAKRSYSWLNLEGKSVLDVGANFGAFTKMALDRGALEVVAYEPENENYCLLIQNCPEATNIRAALISGNDSEINFYLTTSGKNPGNYSTTKFRGRKEITVPALNFAKVLKKFEPNIIKMDCEGSEYDLLLNTKLPECVEEIAIEIHLNKPEWRETKARQLVKLFDQWETVVAPKIGDSNWHTMAGYRRLD